MINKIKNYINKKFNPSYKLDKALTKYLEDYFSNSLYFSLKGIEFTKAGFSMTLDYNLSPVKPEHVIPVKPFSEYFSEVYQKYFEIYLNINDRVERMMNNLESRIEKSFSNLNRGSNIQWVI
jgi:hypothetical protein